MVLCSLVLSTSLVIRLISPMANWFPPNPQSSFATRISLVGESVCMILGAQRWLFDLPDEHRLIMDVYSTFTWTRLSTRYCRAVRWQWWNGHWSCLHWRTGQSVCGHQWTFHPTADRQSAWKGIYSLMLLIMPRLRSFIRPVWIRPVLSHWVLHVNHFPSTCCSHRLPSWNVSSGQWVTINLRPTWTRHMATTSDCLRWQTWPTRCFIHMPTHFRPALVDVDPAPSRRHRKLMDYVATLSPQHWPTIQGSFTLKKQLIFLDFLPLWFFHMMPGPLCLCWVCPPHPFKCFGFTALGEAMFPWPFARPARSTTFSYPSCFIHTTSANQGWWWQWSAFGQSICDYCISTSHSSSDCLGMEWDPWASLWRAIGPHPCCLDLSVEALDHWLAHLHLIALSSLWHMPRLIIWSLWGVANFYLKPWPTLVPTLSVLGWRHWQSLWSRLSSLATTVTGHAWPSASWPPQLPVRFKATGQRVHRGLDDRQIWATLQSLIRSQNQQLLPGSSSAPSWPIPPSTFAGPLLHHFGDSWTFTPADGCCKLLPILVAPLPSGMFAGILDFMACPRMRPFLDFMNVSWAFGLLALLHIFMASALKQWRLSLPPCWSPRAFHGLQSRNRPLLSSTRRDPRQSKTPCSKPMPGEPWRASLANRANPSGLSRKMNFKHTLPKRLQTSMVPTFPHGRSCPRSQPLHLDPSTSARTYCGFWPWCGGADWSCTSHCRSSWSCNLWLNSNPSFHQRWQENQHRRSCPADHSRSSSWLVLSCWSLLLALPCDLHPN